MHQSLSVSVVGELGEKGFGCLFQLLMAGKAQQQEDGAGDRVQSAHRKGRGIGARLKSLKASPQ